MKKIFLCIFLICILSFSIFSDISEDVKEEILLQSKDIMKYMFNGLCDTSFVDRTYDVGYRTTTGNLDSTILVYNLKNDVSLKDIKGEKWYLYVEPELSIYHFYFEENKFTGIQCGKWDQSNIKKRIKLKEVLKKTRAFIKKYRPDLDDYFLKIYFLNNYKNDFHFGFSIYYKGYQTSEIINVTMFKTGLFKYFFIDNLLDYKIPDKIITFEEAKEKVKEFIKENYSGDKYYEDVYSKFKFIESEISQNIDKYSRLSDLKHGKPVFLHANTKIGKYKISYYRDEKNNIKIDYSNVEKYGYTEKDFKDGIYESLFSRLGYLVYIDYPLLNRKRLQKKYTVFFVDAETGEIIGGE